MTATVDWQTWLQRWDAQQSNYLPDREHSLRLILDIVERLAGPTPRLLDLGCGPGSLLGRARHRFPTADLTGVDLDPFLLELARQAHPDSATYIQANYCEKGWLKEGTFDAITSVSAIHYLSPSQLGPLLATLASHLRPGGVLVIADTLRLDPHQRPQLDRLAVDLRQHLWDGGGAPANAETWTDWWQSAHTEPAFKTLLNQRASALATLTEPETAVTLPMLMNALASAGFTEVGPLYQSADHHVIAAVR
ncbi:class I SAM-dependent methyltransferase [Kribbella sp. NPDC023855]|uniref:class I SAM-dependent methyltransferase n=1 Tax=Kribbella sp. NPDC023855 TaxID=3154698 RepID=UPI0033CCB1B9